jgi:hypothetical protein
MPCRNWIPVLAALTAASLVPSTLPAQGERPTASVPGNGFGFGAVLGWTSISGDYGDLITDGVPAQGSIWYQTGALRLGSHIQVASYNVVAPFESQSISQVELAASAGWHFNRHRPLQPFVGLRAGAIRFRPEGAVFDPEPPGPDVPPGENPAPERTGFVGGVFGGLEYWISRHFAAQASVVYRMYSTETLDVPILGVTGIETGRTFDLRFGVEWTP